MTPAERHAAYNAMQDRKVKRLLMTRCGFSVRLRSETPDEHDDRVAEDRLARWYNRMDDETATRDVLGNLK